MADKEMIDRVAWAIVQSLHWNILNGKPQSWSDLTEHQEALIKKSTVEAIKAMREPTQAMMSAAIKKGIDVGFGCGYPEYEDVYKATIGSILND